MVGNRVNRTRQHRNPRSRPSCTAAEKAQDRPRDLRFVRSDIERCVSHQLQESCMVGATDSDIASIQEARLRGTGKRMSEGCRT